jgi:5'-3' exoribonuclease 1
MGVPSFFKYLIEKYDNIIFYKPDLPINYLFFDLNGLLHPSCQKISSLNPNLKDENLLETKMLKQIIIDLDEKISFVNGLKMIYIAIDGPPPRAKINTQRSRRYKSSKLIHLENKIKKKHNIPILHKWNSSKITPGTKFMEKVIEVLKKYIKLKLKNIKVIFSGGNVPGEGEHKIFNYIRKLPKTDKSSMAIYGLDADLIFLGLASMRNNMYLLRESDFMNIGKIKDEPDILHYFSIDILRNALLENINEKMKQKSINKKLDDLRLIKDYIIICFFIGNDFLPHMPGISVRHGGVDLLLEMYLHTQSLFNKNIYLIDTKLNINMEFLYLFITNLSGIEKKLVKKSINRGKPHILNKKFDSKYEKEMALLSFSPKIKDLIKYDKVDYDIRYIKYFFKDQTNIYKGDIDIVDICNSYLKTISWIAKYYFGKLASWTWYYPYLHTPLLSHLYKNFHKLDKQHKFKKGKSYLPFTQLFMVLPYYSRNILPTSLTKLVESKKLSEYFPIHFAEDFNNKYYRWQAIPLLPFIDENKINVEINKCKFTKEELKRNKFGRNQTFRKSL